MDSRRILFLGDVCSEAGRDAVRRELPALKEDKRADVVLVNVENVAGGYGISPRIADELLAAGIDCMTTGDHAFDRKDSWDYYRGQERILRPLNYPAGAPGRGAAVYEKDGFKFAVVSLLGRVFMKPLDCPFQRVESVLRDLRQETRTIIVDMHAEATAEKQALGWFLDGGVSAVLGSHTHVQTADERILPGGTAYITDVGMCGAFDSVLGMKTEDSLLRLREMLPYRLHPASGDVRLNGVVVEVEPESGKAVSIERFSIPIEPPEEPEPEQVEAEPTD